MIGISQHKILTDTEMKKTGGRSVILGRGYFDGRSDHNISLSSQQQIANTFVFERQRNKTLTVKFYHWMQWHARDKIKVSNEMIAFNFTQRNKTNNEVWDNSRKKFIIRIWWGERLEGRRDLMKKLLFLFLILSRQEKSFFLSDTCKPSTLSTFFLHLSSYRWDVAQSSSKGGVERLKQKGRETFSWQHLSRPEGEKTPPNERPLICALTWAIFLLLEWVNMTECILACITCPPLRMSSLKEERHILPTSTIHSHSKVQGLPSTSFFSWSTSSISSFSSMGIRNTNIGFLRDHERQNPNCTPSIFIIILSHLNASDSQIHKLFSLHPSFLVSRFLEGMQRKTLFQFFILENLIPCFSFPSWSNPSLEDSVFVLA